MGKFTPFLLLMVILTLAIACQRGEKKSEGPGEDDPVFTVEVAKVQSREIPDLVEIKGFFVPTQRIKINSEFSGRLEELAAVKGQVINQGSPLLRIEDDSLTPELERLNTQLQQAEEQLEQNRQLALEESLEEEGEEEEVVEVQVEEPFLEEVTERIPTFAELAQEIPFTTEDAGGVWAEVDPRILAVANDPQDAGGVWPSYGDGVRFQTGLALSATREPPLLVAFLPVPDTESPILAPPAEFNDLEAPEESPTATQSEAERESLLAASRLALDQATVDRIRAEIALLQNEVSRRTLYAPFEGKILDVGISVGVRVEPGDFLVEIGQVDPIAFNFNVPKDQVNSLELGMDIQGMLLYPTWQPFDGQISFIGAELIPDNDKVEVRLNVNNSEDSIKIRMEGIAKIPSPQITHEGLLIPANALLQEKERIFVYVIKGSLAVKREVTTTGSYEGLIEIETGLQANDRVVTGGLRQLKGDEVPIRIDS